MKMAKWGKTIHFHGITFSDDDEKINCEEKKNIQRVHIGNHESAVLRREREREERESHVVMWKPNLEHEHSRMTSSWQSVGEAEHELKAATRGNVP